MTNMHTFSIQTHSRVQFVDILKSSLVGASAQILVEEGKLILGTWQAVYFCEFDGPRHRKCHVQAIGKTP